MRVQSGGAAGAVALYVFSTDTGKKNSGLKVVFRSQELVRAETRIRDERPALPQRPPAARRRAVLPVRARRVAPALARRQAPLHRWSSGARSAPATRGEIKLPRGEQHARARRRP